MFHPPQNVTLYPTATYRLRRERPACLGDPDAGSCCPRSLTVDQLSSERFPLPSLRKGMRCVVLRSGTGS